MIRYLLDVGNSFVTKNECLDTNEFQNKHNFLHFKDNKTLLDNILDKLNRSLELNEQIENNIGQNDEEFDKTNKEKQQKFNHIVDEIENKQRIIDHLGPIKQGIPIFEEIDYSSICRFI